MTYKDLLPILSKMTEDDLENDIVLEFDDELFAVSGAKVADDTEDRTDEGCLILIARTTAEEEEIL